MKRLMLAAAFVRSWLSAPASAQEHYTEGPVWVINDHRTEPDRGDEYLKWLRARALPQVAEEKRQGVVLDYRFFFNTTTRDEKDWDFAVAFLYPSDGKALDYGAEDEAKQREMEAPRWKMGTLVGTNIVREMTLKPAP